MMMMMMVVVAMLPIPVPWRAVWTTGYLVHLVFGQILQWWLVKWWFLRKHVTSLFFIFLLFYLYKKNRNKQTIEWRFFFFFKINKLNKNFYYVINLLQIYLQIKISLCAISYKFFSSYFNNNSKVKLNFFLIFFSP